MFCSQYKNKDAKMRKFSTILSALNIQKSTSPAPTIDEQKRARHNHLSKSLCASHQKKKKPKQIKRKQKWKKIQNLLIPICIGFDNGLSFICKNRNARPEYYAQQILYTCVLRRVCYERVVCR